MKSKRSFTIPAVIGVKTARSIAEKTWPDYGLRKTSLKFVASPKALAALRIQSVRILRRSR